ncbi:class I SAM-dependent methyltransferase family protein [Candidatus Woesearchaeota archaeon]|nr:class I SAM-dependent methyltransferase family protein [Candidatus Woesearchaeota archaeon]
MKLPSSFDVIGNIAILPEKTKNASKVARELIKNFKNIKTVAIKTGIHYGKFRLQKTKVLAGKKTKSTLHKENGCIFKLNIDKTYFSPRLANERLRIARLVKKNETVLVMFSGIGIYPIEISKFSKTEETYGIEINPEAHKFAQENIRLNKVVNVSLFSGDVRKVLPKIKKSFDRIVMPLPRDAESYLDLAIKKLKPNGIIHFYDFQREEDIPKASIEKIKKHCNPKILNVVKVGQYSPGRYRLCIDFTF